MSEKIKAIIIVSLVIFFLSGSFLYNGIVQHDRTINSLIEITEKDTHCLLSAMDEYTFKSYRLRIQHLLDSSPQIIEAFATRNRKLLYELASPQFEDHHCENKFLDIMHFHLPDGTTFLRVHKPDFFGDNLQNVRPVINTVNRNQKPLSGFEIGRQGAFYRIVQPIFFKGTYVGVLEFGISTYQIIDVLESGAQIKAAAFFLERVWQKATHYNATPVVKTGNFILTSHNASLSDQLPKGFQFGEDSHPIITDDKQSYVVHSHLVFNDFQGKSLGGLVLFQDITKIIEQKKSFIFRLFISTAVMLALAIIVLYCSFGKIISSLRQKETELSSIFRTAPTGIGVVANRIFMNVNDNFCKMVGHSREELLGKNARIVYPTQEEYEEVGQEQLKQFKGLGTGTMETRLQHEDGTIIDVQLKLTPQDLNNLSAGITFTFMDVTEIKNAEKKLRESENKFRSMMEAMRDPAYICSPNYRVEYMNPAMIRRTGRDATGEFCYQALHDFEQPCSWCQIKGERYGKNFESEIVSPKDERSFQTSHSPITNDDNSFSCLTILRDTTEFKKMEAQFYQSQKMEAIGTLAAGVAHDFNNILTVIKGHAQLGIMRRPEESLERDSLMEIEAASDRARNLTRQLLAFSRKQAINPEMIQINYLLNDLNKMLKRLIGEDVHLITDLNEKLSPILADPGQIEQIIINLVVNAADAIKGQPLVSGRNISISTSEVLLDSDFVISHEGSKPGWHLILEVADNGCGIPTEVMEHIFEPFYTTKEVGKGTGLGLSTVYGIVKQNNASIYVESEPGQGTTFKIYWPSVKDAASKIIKNKKLAPVSGGSEVILLVEDEKQTRNLALRILQQAGYTVIEAENGLDALEKAKDLQGSIDLVFTDVVMPVMGGKELNEKLSSIYPQIKFLFTSGYLSDRVDRDDAIFKDEAFVDKPYDVLVVLSKIRQLLDSRGV